MGVIVAELTQEEVDLMMSIDAEKRYLQNFVVLDEKVYCYEPEKARCLEVTVDITPVTSDDVPEEAVKAIMIKRFKLIDPKKIPTSRG